MSWKPPRTTSVRAWPATSGSPTGGRWPSRTRTSPRWPSAARDCEVALTLAGAAETLREEIGSPRAPAQTEALDAVLQPARTALGDQAVDLVAAGHALTPEAAVALAESACAG